MLDQGSNTVLHSSTLVSAPVGCVPGHVLDSLEEILVVLAGTASAGEMARHGQPVLGSQLG